MSEKVCKLPEIVKLKELLRDKNNLIWYSRFPEWDGPKESMEYLKNEIEKFKQEKKQKYGGL